MKHLLFVFALALSVVGCASTGHKEARYLKRILFSPEELEKWDESNGRYSKIYVDSVLLFRPFLPPDYFVFDTQDTFLVEGKIFEVQPKPLNIPPKWKDKYIYFHGDLHHALANDSTSIFFYSPLLKSGTIKHRYYLQTYVYQQMNVEGEEYWFYMRILDRFDLKGNKIIKLEPEYLTGDFFNKYP